MAKTLAGAKPKLQADLLKLLQKAAYEAYMTSQEQPTDTDSMVKASLKKELIQAATNFANKFAQTAAQPMADAIYNFAKEIGIIMTPSGALISTSIMTPSPVIGTCPMQDFKIL